MRVIKRVLIGIALAVTLVYFTGAIYFKERYLPGTTMDGKDVSYKHHNEIRHRFRKEYLTEVTVKSPSREIQKFSHEDIGYEVKTEIPLNSRASWKWPAVIFFPESLSTETTVAVEEDIARTTVEESVFIKRKEAPKDAYIKAENGEAYIVPETHDYKADKEVLVGDLIEAFLEGKREIEVRKFELPKVTKDDKELKARLKEMNDYFNSKVNIVAYNERKETKLIKELLDNEDISKDLIRESVKALAEKVNTIDKSREFKTHSGHEITVPAGTYGWKVDIDKSVEKVFKAIKDGEYSNIGLEYSTHGFKNADIGNTFIEVDLSTQDLYFVRNGKVVMSSPIVSGQVPGAHTPTGVHSIKYKEPNRYLKGSNRITKVSYSSFVNFWMPVDYTGIGLHDASWQNGDFNENKYKTSAGSNGCINLPYKAAKYLYDTAATGTPVLIYETTTNNSNAPY